MNQGSRSCYLKGNKHCNPGENNGFIVISFLLSMCQHCWNISIPQAKLVDTIASYLQSNSTFRKIILSVCCGRAETVPCKQGISICLDVHKRSLCASKIGSKHSREHKSYSNMIHHYHDYAVVFWIFSGLHDNAPTSLRKFFLTSITVSIKNLIGSSLFCISYVHYSFSFKCPGHVLGMSLDVSNVLNLARTPFFANTRTYVPCVSCVGSMSWVWSHDLFTLISTAVLYYTIHAMQRFRRKK